MCFESQQVRYPTLHVFWILTSMLPNFSSLRKHVPCKTIAIVIKNTFDLKQLEFVFLDHTLRRRKAVEAVNYVESECLRNLGVFVKGSVEIFKMLSIY